VILNYHVHGAERGAGKTILISSGAASRGE
jgi:hypothetical protein